MLIKQIMKKRFEFYTCNDINVTYNTYISAKDNYAVELNYLKQLEQTKRIK